jgi:hypothetical protein
VPCTIVSAGLEHIILDLLREAGFHDAVSAAHCDGAHDARIRVLASAAGVLQAPPSPADRGAAGTASSLRATANASAAGRCECRTPGLGRARRLPQDPHVTSGNKRELTYTLLRAHFDAAPGAPPRPRRPVGRAAPPRKFADAARRRLVVIGDSCGDARVAGLVPAASTLTVGYFDPGNHWKTRPDFEEAFDVLLPHTDDLFWLTALLRDLERKGAD